MTDRVKGFTVVLGENIRIDDVQPILEAIQMVKGVQRVEPIIVTGTEALAELKVELEVKEKLYKFIENDLFKENS